MSVTLLQKWLLLQAAIPDPNLSLRAKVVLAALLDVKNTRTGLCVTDLDALAERTACGRRVISDALKNLTAGKWLTIKRRRGISIYYPNFERPQDCDDVQKTAHHTDDEDVQNSAYHQQAEDVQNSAYLETENPQKMCGILHGRCAESRMGDVRNPAHLCRIRERRTGKEESGKEERARARARTARRATTISLDWSPTDSDVQFARDEGLTDQECQRQAERFRDYWLGNGKPHKDWSATWRNWIRREVDNPKPAARPDGRHKPSMVDIALNFGGLERPK